MESRHRRDDQVFRLAPLRKYIHDSLRKWKVDKSAVHNLSCYGDGSLLLTAGRTIKLWSLEDYTIIKVSAENGCLLEFHICVDVETSRPCHSHSRSVFYQ